MIWLGHFPGLMQAKVSTERSAADCKMMRFRNINRLLGLVACFSFQVREVPSSIPRAALAIEVLFVSDKCILPAPAVGMLMTLLIKVHIGTVGVRVSHLLNLRRKLQSITDACNQTFQLE